MISTNEFLKEVEDKKYKVVETDEEYKIIKKDVIYAIVGKNEQYSTTFKNTPVELKKLVRKYEDTKIKDRSGYFRIPLKNLNLGGEQLYISFNRISEQFGAMGKLLFDSEFNLTQIFTKEDLESEHFKQQIGDYLQWVEEI